MHGHFATGSTYWAYRVTLQGSTRHFNTNISLVRDPTLYLGRNYSKLCTHARRRWTYSQNQLSYATAWTAFSSNFHASVCACFNITMFILLNVMLNNIAGINVAQTELFLILLSVIHIIVHGELNPYNKWKLTFPSSNGTLSVIRFNCLLEMSESITQKTDRGHP